MIKMSMEHGALYLQIVTYDYGMKDENPIDHVRFYLKTNPERAVKVRKDQVWLSASHCPAHDCHECATGVSDVASDIQGAAY